MLFVSVALIFLASCEKEQLDNSSTATNQSAQMYSEDVTVFDKTGDSYVTYKVASQDMEALNHMVNTLSTLSLSVESIEEIKSGGKESESVTTSGPAESKNTNQGDVEVSLTAIDSKIPEGYGYTIDLSKSTYLQQKGSSPVWPRTTLTINVGVVTGFLLQNYGTTNLSVIHQYNNGGWQTFGVNVISPFQYYNNTSTGTTEKRAIVNSLHSSIGGFVVWSTYL